MTDLSAIIELLFEQEEKLEQKITDTQSPIDERSYLFGQLAMVDFLLMRIEHNDRRRKT